MVPSYPWPVHALLRPRWIAGHLLAVVTVVGFVNLGLWQFDRHAEKVGLRDEVAAAQAQDPIPIEAAPVGAYRRVIATGSYDGSLQTTVLRSQGGVSGYHVLTPLRFADDRAVLIDRGWIPLDAVPPQPLARVVTITGTLWPAAAGSGIPDALLPAVRRIDPAIVAAFADYRLIDEYLVLSGEDRVAEALPVLPTPPTISLGSHRSYAVQWLLFAGVVAIGYPLLLRRTVRRG